MTPFSVFAAAVEWMRQNATGDTSFFARHPHGLHLIRRFVYVTNVHGFAVDDEPWYWTGEVE